jgi:hypothetical protein
MSKNHILSYDQKRVGRFPESAFYLYHLKLFNNCGQMFAGLHSKKLIGFPVKDKP